jgi:hypothetical protein
MEKRVYIEEDCCLCLNDQTVTDYRQKNWRANSFRFLWRYVMWDGVLDFTIKLAVPALIAFGFIFVKKGCQVIAKKLNIEINAREWEIIDKLIVVRSVEEDSKTNLLSSEDKEELALAKIKQSSDLEVSKNLEDSVLRTKIKACVNKLYNNNRLKDK